ncbi:MAG: ATP-binding protein [Acidobacteriota bacterium]|nr:ATP-binding protein [Acidobacteriota bacterium]
MVRYGNRYQFGLSLLTGFFLLATFFAVLLYLVWPTTPATRGPLLLAAFVAILLGSLVCILLVLRWVLRPYRQLVGEAEKASIQSQAPKSQDESEFVLETFQSVVGQLQEQRNALEQLSTQASKRADSAEKFSERIVASVPSGLIAFDGSGRSMVINAPGRALLNVDRASLGQPAAVVLQNIPQLAKMVEQCLQTGRLYRREEIEAVTSEHLPRRIGATVAPIDLSTDGGQRGALCLLTDITEVTQLREQVALKKNLENLGEMSAGLAHEFKNAIAALHGYVQLLQTLPLDEDARGTTSSLLNEVRNLSEMVTSFLNFARPQPLQLDEVSVSELITECADELGPLFAERQVELLVAANPVSNTCGSGWGLNKAVSKTGNVDIPSASGNADGRGTAGSPGGVLDSLSSVDSDDANQKNQLVIIPADERMLRQALLNLIRNAAEAIPVDKSERRVEIDTSTERDKAGKDWAIVVVKDSGEGIPASDLQRIFIPFFTTKATGHGVGLALAHRVITQHGGTLTASNAPGSGAIFTVRLPA